jgi:hypothetical protein
MASMTQDEVRAAIKNAPKGTTPEGIVAALREQGFKLEGHPDSVTVREHYRNRPAKAEATGVAPSDSTVPTMAPPGAAEAVAAAAPPGEPPLAPEDYQNATKTALAAAIPGTMATLASFSPAGPVGGAMIGGLSGKATNYGLGLEPQPTDLAGAFRGLGGEAAKQGVLARLGQGLALGAKGAGNLAMRLGAKIPPELVPVAVREGIDASKPGLKRLADKIGNGAADTEQLAKTYDRRGIRHDLNDVVKEAMADVWDQVKNGDQPEIDKKRLEVMGQRYLQRLRKPNTSKLLDMRITADKIAQPIHDAISAAQAGVPGARMPGPRTALRGLFQKAIADAERNRLNVLDFNPLTGDSPMMRSNQYTHELMQLRDAMAPAAKSRSGLRVLGEAGLPYAVGGTVGGALTPGDYQHKAGGAVAGALAAKALMTPQAMSQIALLLNNPAFASFLTRAPLGANAAISPLVAGQ